MTISFKAAAYNRKRRDSRNWYRFLVRRHVRMETQPWFIYDPVKCYFTISLIRSIRAGCSSYLNLIEVPRRRFQSAFNGGSVSAINYKNQARIESLVVRLKKKREREKKKIRKREHLVWKISRKCTKLKLYLILKRIVLEIYTSKILEEFADRMEFDE